MANILNDIENIGMIPVISIDKKQRALPLADALSKGGLPLMEVMFRTDDAASSIAIIAQNRPEFIIGAGTITSEEQVKQAIDSGAKFLVSPGFNPKIIACANKYNIPIIPGCISPTEVEMAIDLGCYIIKFFPAVQNGGLAAMKLLSGPYPKIKFIPTGDLTKELSTEYLSFHKVAATGGDYMLSYDDLYNENYDKITSDVEQTILSYLNFHIAHVGMNEQSKERAFTLAQKLSLTLKLQTTVHSKSTFSGSLFEIMHNNFYHEKGHIAIGTKDATRAYHYLKRCNVEFFEETVSYDANSRVIAAYMKENFSGFALHLLQD